MIDQLYQIVRDKKLRERQQQPVNDLKTKIESLCLYFILPTNPQIEIKRNGKNLEVNLSNLEEYLQLLVQFMIFESIKG